MRGVSIRPRRLGRLGWRLTFAFLAVSARLDEVEVEIECLRAREFELDGVEGWPLYEGWVQRACFSFAVIDAMC